MRNKQLKSLATFVLSVAVLVGSTTAGYAHGTLDGTMHSMLKVKTRPTATYVNGYSPEQLRTAYGVNAQSKRGAGETIAIVDAYGDSNIENDLNVFDQRFGLSAPKNISVSYPQGKPTSTDGGWALETALDVEWAHAMAPDANLLVIAAKSASTQDLLNAIQYANNHSAQVVSMSWGGNESRRESSLDSNFSHSGVVYLASAGDDGAQSSWPATSSKVVAVGGTTLKLDSSNHRTSETAWNLSGGDISQYINEPAWQASMRISSNGMRGTPDVSFDADPNTGVAVYSSIDYNGSSGWSEVGGTSLSAPAWAGLIADGDNYSALSGANQVLYKLAGGTSYTNPQNAFYDVVSGSNGNNASQGYDFVTGLGSPKADKLLPLL